MLECIINSTKVGAIQKMTSQKIG